MTINVEASSAADELHDRFIQEALPLVDQLYRVARRYTKSHSDAEDLAQEVMMRAYDKFDHYNKGTNVKAWLFRILTNTWINRYRAAERRPKELLIEEYADIQKTGVRQSAISTSSAELIALESLGDDDVRQALQRLPESQRMALFYVDVEGFRYRQVAEILDIPFGTVMSTVHRGRRTLRTLLVDKAAAYGYLENVMTAADTAE